MPDEAFNSHAHTDREALLQLSAVLTRHGVAHWFAEREILGAQRWNDEIGAALRRCDWFVVLLSPDAIASRGSARRSCTRCVSRARSTASCP